MKTKNKNEVSIEKSPREEKVQITDSEEEEESDLLRDETFITSTDMDDFEKYKNWDTRKNRVGEFLILSNSKRYPQEKYYCH